MKKIIIAISSLVVLSSASADGQNFNPFVLQGNVTPSILYDLASNGTGQLTFEVGNTGTDPLVLTSDQEMLLTISLSRGVPNNTNPIAAIGGSFASYFNWLYDAATNTYQGKQNQMIPSGANGLITIDYQVTSNSMMSSPQNGFNVNITPPAYSNGVNAMNDDQISFYTWTEKLTTPIGQVANVDGNFVSANPNEVTSDLVPVPLTPDTKEIINAASNSAITVYPNPAIEYINISLSALKETKYSIKITDLEGKSLTETETIVNRGSKIVRVSTSHIASGIYNVTVTSDSETKTFKVKIKG